MPFHTGFIADRTTPRIATSGALTIGVKLVPPIPPRLEMVNVPPAMSAGPSFPSRAFAEISMNSRDRSTMPLRSASRTTGTTSPPGVSTAIPML